MKFVYVDETGDEGQSDIFVMVGIEIDYTKLNKYTKVFSASFDEIFARHDGNPDDFKTRRFHRGAGGWNVIPGNERKAFMGKIIELVAESCKLYSFSLSFEKLKAALESGENVPEGINNYWIPSALFILSHIQRTHCEDKNNKGNCVIVIDDNKAEHDNMAELIYQPPNWLDDLAFKSSFLDKKRRPKNWEEQRFSQIVNTPFAIKSQHASMVQVADLVAFVMRRYLELKSEEEAFDGEAEFFESLINLLNPKIMKQSNLKKNTEPYKFYKSIQPENCDFQLK